MEATKKFMSDLCHWVSSWLVADPAPWSPGMLGLQWQVLPLSSSGHLPFLCEVPLCMELMLPSPAVTGEGGIRKAEEGL